MTNNITKYLKRYMDKFGDLWDEIPFDEFHIKRVKDGNIGYFIPTRFKILEEQGLKYYGLVEEVITNQKIT